MSAAAPVALPHPLVDASGPGWAATVVLAPIVGISSGRAALFVDCARYGVQVILVTRPDARLTYPLFQLMQSVGAVWLTREHDGALRHAVSRMPVAGYEEATGPASASAALLESPQAVIGTATVIGTDTAEEPSTAWLQFAVSTHHPARAEAVMGGTLESLVEGIAGETAISWGTSEPVVLSWDRIAMSGAARARMPQDSRFFVAGAGDIPFRATVRVSRSEIGVSEETRIVFAVSDAAALDAAATSSLLARVAERQQVLLGSAWTMRGAADATIAAGREVRPQPVAAVIGARGVRALGLDGSVGSRVPGAIRVGNRRSPSLIVDFGGDETRWQSFGSVIESIGVAELTNALFPTEIAPSEVRRAS